MRSLIHISDLHFGAIDSSLLDPLLAFIEHQKPDLVINSGDLTQRARKRQFIEARQFLDRIHVPMLVVPGNHDIPWHRLLMRFSSPMKRFRQHITSELEPFHHDDEIAVLGINTARPLTTQYGRISDRQLAMIADRFRSFPRHMKIVVTHHPFDLPIGDPNSRQLTARAELAMAVIATSEVDLLLSGHLHLASAGITTERYSIGGYAALHVHAGTATSTRGRGQTNSANVLRVERDLVRVERHEWSAERRHFEVVQTSAFVRERGRWAVMASMAA